MPGLGDTPWLHDLLTQVRLPLLRLRRGGFLMTVIELPDEQAADGLTLEAWLNKLAGAEVSAEQEQPADRPRRHIADVIIENKRKVPPEIMATMPTDGASQHDHYLYGWPKKEA